MRPIRLAVISLAHASAATALLAGPIAAHAEVQSRFAMDLPAQPLGDSIRALAVLSGRTILAEAPLVAGKQAPPMHGVYSVEEALSVLLGGTDLEFARVEDAYVIRRVVRPAIEAASSAEQAIVVTGTRIRGGPIASPVISIGQGAIRDAGQSDLGDVARSLPQSFGGGQNPGVGFNVPSSAGGNIGGGSSFNLRGLGSDATLTILNGRRLPYDSSRQGVDVSAIPLAAVDRIEIVPDGSSALYGSDAVGGVVNVVLKHDFAGLETRARLGDSTDGGDHEQRYSAIAGGRWRGGGGFIAYEFNDNSPILAADRRYAASRPGITLLPGSTRHAVTASGHQQLTGSLSVEADGLYNDRSSATTYPLNLAGDLSLSRTRQSFDATSYSFAAALRWSVDEWRVSLTGTFGRNRTSFRGDTYTNDVFKSSAGGRYDNRSLTGEVAADGPLFQLPAGPAKVAFGAGARKNDFELFRGAGALQNINASQDVTYAYGELNLPLFSPEWQTTLIRRLNLSGAVRYEHYRGIADVFTPKLGVIYSPADLLDLKATWGRSFRAPSFIQQYQIQQALLYPSATFGGAGFPAGSTALLHVGGNRNLRPERARSWSATLAFHPPSVPSFGAELSYFSTRYLDRIVNPIPLLTQALSNPIYREQITFNPTPAQQAAIIAAAAQFINVTGSPYDPARVAALIDSANVNAGRQSIQGVDALVHCRTDIRAGSLEFSLNASYLDSKQQLAPAQPVQPLSGILFNPPHWRARGMFRWESGGFSLASVLSFTGGVTDPRSTPALHIGGTTTADLNARYRFPDHHGPLKGVELSVAVQNIFNDAPSTIATSVYYDTPYDSTNYSPVGRFIVIEFAKRW